MLNIYGELFAKKNVALNLCFLFNAAGAGTLLPIVILYLSEYNLTESQVLFLGTIKFLSHSLFFFFIVPLIGLFDIKKIITLSLLAKAMAFLLFYLNTGFWVCLIVMLINGLSSAIFSIATKLYIRSTSDDVGKSFSVRMTMNNIGASLAPLIISAMLYAAIPFSQVVLILSTLYAISVIAVLGLKSTPARNENKHIDLNTLHSKKTYVVGAVSLVFSMLYYLFETTLPLRLVDIGMKDLVGPVLLLNTLAIILLQIPVFAFFTARIGVLGSILFSMAICIVLSIPYLYLPQALWGIVLIVVGLSFLEMFYGAGVDTLIARSSSQSEATLLYGVSSITLSCGALLATWMYTYYLFLFMPCVMLLYLMIIKFRARYDVYSEG